MLECLGGCCVLAPAVLLPLAHNLSKLGNLAKLVLCPRKKFFEDAKSLLVLELVLFVQLPTISNKLERSSSMKMVYTPFCCLLA